jgi:hypothetical protein
MPINVLRSVRAFRLIRLFRRLRALRDIIFALSVAVFPVLNAFLILVMIASICTDNTHAHAHTRTSTRTRTRTHTHTHAPGKACIVLVLSPALLSGSIE